MTSVILNPSNYMHCKFKRNRMMIIMSVGETASLNCGLHMVITPLARIGYRIQIQNLENDIFVTAHRNNIAFCCMNSLLLL
jgi:hypothetical protein